MAASTSGGSDGGGSRHVQGPQGFPAAGWVERQPVANGLAVVAHAWGYCLLRPRLPAGQRREYLPPWSLAPVMFMWSPLLEGCCIVGHDREGWAQRLRSSGGISSPPRRADVCIVIIQNSY